MKEAYNFRGEWRLITDSPYPSKKLCRAVIREISNARKLYGSLFYVMQCNILGDDLIFADDKKKTVLQKIQTQIKNLLFAAEVLLDAHEIQPHPLRHRRKLLTLIEKLKRERIIVNDLVAKEKEDLSILWDLTVDTLFTPFSDIAQVPERSNPYFIWQKN